MRSVRIQPKLGLPLTLLASLLVLPAAAEGTECSYPPIDDRCETWMVETDYGENCCDPVWVPGFNSSRHFLASEQQLLLTLPVNDPGLPSLQERWDFQTTSFSSGDGEVLWKQRYSGPAWDIPLSLAVSPNHERVYVTGFRDFPKTPNTISLGGCVEDFEPASALTIAYGKQDGQEIWRSGFSSPSFLDAAFSSVLSADGDILYQVGIRLGGNPNVCDFDAAVAALDAHTGEELWGLVVVRGSHQTWSYDAAYGIDITPDGQRLVLAGVTRDASRRADFFASAIALSQEEAASPHAPGRVEWLATYDDGIGGDDEMMAMAFDPIEGRVFVTGRSVDGINAPCSLVFVTGCAMFHYSTVGYDVATGQELWRSRYIGPALNQREDTPHAITVSPDGNRVFVTGESTGTDEPDWDYATVAYDSASGVELWVDRYGAASGHIEWAHDVVSSPDGSRVYVTGESTHVIGTPQLAATLALDAETGDRIWVARLDGPRGPTDSTHGDQLALSSDSSQLFVSGWAENGRDPENVASGQRDFRGLIFSYEL